MSRVRHGRGFSYRNPGGRRITDSATLDRIVSLAIPPAWEDVWICPDDRGHLQATGTDAAGRRQYLYHPVWREQRDRQKFRDMEAFARRLPRVRRYVEDELRGSDEPTKEHVAAGAVRLLDIGLFRVGGEESAGEFGHFGLATLTSKHLQLEDGKAVFDYPAKSGVRRVIVISDAGSVALLRRLRRRRSGPEELIAYHQGRQWHPLGGEGINGYIKATAGAQFSAKDFRTWNATVWAAALLATSSEKSSRQRVIRRVTSEVSDLLGNTPAVARRSYIDPRVFDRYLAGATINLNVDPHDSLEALAPKRRRKLETEVLHLLR